MNTNSFITNVNILVDNLEEIASFNYLSSNKKTLDDFVASGVSEYLPLVEDLVKGTYKGNRQIQLNIYRNLPINVQTDLESFFNQYLVNNINTEIDYSHYVPELTQYKAVKFVLLDNSIVTYNFDSVSANTSSIATIFDQIGLALTSNSNVIINTSKALIRNYTLDFSAVLYDHLNQFSNIQQILLITSDNSVQTFDWSSSTSSVEYLSGNLDEIINVVVPTIVNTKNEIQIIADNATAAVNAADASITQSTIALNASTTALNAADVLISESTAAVNSSNDLLAAANTLINTSTTTLASYTTVLNTSTTALSTANSELASSTTAVNTANTLIVESTTAVNASNVLISESTAALDAYTAALNASNTTVDALNSNMGNLVNYTATSVTVSSNSSHIVLITNSVPSWYMVYSLSAVPSDVQANYTISIYNGDASQSSVVNDTSNLSYLSSNNSGELLDNIPFAVIGSSATKSIVINNSSGVSNTFNIVLAATRYDVPSTTVVI